MIPTLETVRLRLRPFVAADAPVVAALAGDRRVAEQTLTVPHPYRLDDAIAWIATLAPAAAAGEQFTFGIERRDDRNLVGAIALHLAPAHRRAELGYWIGVDHWNRGYATEAARAAIAFGFDVLGLHRIEAHHFAANPASGRVLLKAGMSYEGLLRGHVFRDGTPRDGCLYARLRTDGVGPLDR